jgi:sulfopyruvate decarboxylase subunit beta
MARGAGIPLTETVQSLDGFQLAFDAALNARDLTTLVARVEAVGPAGFVTDLALLENRYQFQRHLQHLKDRT